MNRPTAPAATGMLGTDTPADRMPLVLAVLALVPAAWLVPNHYPPWLSSWSDCWALAFMLLAAMLQGRTATLAGPWLAALGVALVSVLAQTALGTIYFGGDAVMVAVYLLAFGVALLLGSTLPGHRAGRSGSGVDHLAAGIALAAGVSVAVALVQWTGAFSLGIYGADLPKGSRPFGNVGQPNHLCTLAFMGLVSLAVLHENQRVGRAVWWLGAGFLMLGMVMSGSRTGWLQMALLPPLLAFLQRRGATARLRWPQALGLSLAFALATALWPAINEAVQLAGQRAAEGQVSDGGRLPLWLALTDAIGRQPLWGYGWQQVILAQQAVALDHPPVLRHFDHAHNIVMDLLLWAGIPIGGAIVLLCGWGLVRQARAIADTRAAWLYVGVIGLLVHGLLELPLEYAYFLLPAGLMLGAVQAMSPPAGRLWTAPRLALPVLGVLGLLLLLAIATEYLRAEQSYRVLRFEMARIGSTRIDSTTPDLPLLTQIRAFQQLARTEPRTGMQAAEVLAVQRAAMRYPYPSAMFRHALVAALNGDPATARLTLARLCSIHPKKHCDAMREGWREEQARHPALAAIAPP